MPPCKPARADTAVDNNDGPEPNPLHSTRNLPEMISLLKPAQAKKFLADAATNHPDVMASLNKWNNARLARIAKQREKELTTEISFHHMIDQVIFIINKATKEKCDQSTAQYAQYVVCCVMREIQDQYLSAIVNKTQQGSRFETKRNAIETIREIFEICLLNSGTSMVGRMIRENLYEFRAFLRVVLETFSKEEMLRLMDPGCQTRVRDGKGGFTTVPWIEAFERTVKLTKDYRVDDDWTLGTSRALAVLNSARGIGPEVRFDQAFQW